MVLAVCAKLGWDLVATPSDLFAILPARGEGH
jgi:hypothetical protein